MSQATHTINLKPTKWDISTKVFYLSNITDLRDDKSNGQILASGKKETISFQNSISSDFLRMINSSMTFDSAGIPLDMAVSKFSFSETGNALKRKVILNYSYKIARVRNGKRYELFDVSGSPEINVTGSYAGLYEKLIENSLQQTLSSFTEWINKNTDNPTLLREVKLVTEQLKSFAENERADTILWCPNQYRLAWTDFKGTSNSDFSAQSNCMFSFSARPEPKNGILNLNIGLYACFTRNNSWVKEGMKADSLLLHEQLHFDICELYARKLRKKLLETEPQLDPLEYSKQITPIFNDIWEAYQKVQNKYDDETEHGLIREMQIRWINDVKYELELLDEYALKECEPVSTK